MATHVLTWFRHKSEEQARAAKEVEEELVRLTSLTESQADEIKELKQKLEHALTTVRTVKIRLLRVADALLEGKLLSEQLLAGENNGIRKQTDDTGQPTSPGN